MKKKKYFYINPDDPNIIKAKGLNDPSIIHHCPSCGEYLWADKSHMSYNFCVYCGKNLKGKKLPYERI